MEEAIESIANDIVDETKDCQYVKNILTNELFYHIGKLTPEKSAQHLGYMIKKLEDTPEIVNSDPYNDGWFYRLQPADASELDKLLSAEDYDAHCAEED